MTIAMLFDAALFDRFDLWRVLPAADAGLNAVAATLLIIGYRLIKRRRETAHKRVMLAAFGVSVVFLACYLTYHIGARLTGRGELRFVGPPAVRVAYRTLLISHVVLAFMVPALAIATIYLGYADRRVAHRRLARWTYPIWLYVSITGVVIYVMLYHLFPSSAP